MGAGPRRLTTRVFRAGNSQAVRIPKALELPEGEAVIEQRPGGLFLRAKRGGWSEFFAKPPLTEDLDPVELRSTGPERVVDVDSMTKKRIRRRRAE
jgi:virulence-associated protein VagC